ncbi:MAG: ABC transporter ATP-binding protein [Candidatus Komeilibacteria bacterium]
MATNLITVKDLYKSYWNDDVETKVLRGLNFTIAEGEYVAIMGPSGSGKSTLMHILGFLDKASSGQYLFRDKDVSKFKGDQLAALRNSEVGFVFQQFNLLSKTSVLENVELPLLYSSVKDKVAMARQAIAAVGLQHRSEYLSNQLSGGEKQRVAIARAIVNQPKVIFADEPTGNLDSRSGNQIMSVFEALHKAGHTVILVTHEQDTANHAARILQIKDGLLERDYVVSHQRTVESGILHK